MEEKPERSEKEAVVKDFCEPLKEENREKCIDFYKDLGAEEETTKVEGE